MSTEQNKSIVRRWIETGWNQGKLDIMEEVYTADVVQHDPTSPQPVTNLEALRSYVRAYLTAFPDLKFTIEDLIAEGDRVLWRFTSRGTHNGSLNGIPPTGKIASPTGMVVFRMANNKIAEVWVNVDVMSMLQQLGIIPMLAPHN